MNNLFLLVLFVGFLFVTGCSSEFVYINSNSNNFTVSNLTVTDNLYVNLSNSSGFVCFNSSTNMLYVKSTACI